MKTTTVVVAVVLVAIVLGGIGASIYLTKPTGYLVIGVKDAPSTNGVTALYLTITDIKLQGEGNASATYKVNATTFNLLKLVNITKMLGKNTVPAGNYTMVRFTVTAATATISGSNKTLTVPSGEIKVPLHFTIASGKTTTVVLDISADMTAISASHNLRPTVTGLETKPPG